MEISDIRTGKPAVKPDAPSHTRGVPEGNLRKRGDEPGLKTIGRLIMLVTARRSTGINAKGRNPIDPRMPHLTPA